MVGLCAVIFSGVSLGQYPGVILVEDFGEYSNGADLSSGKFGGWVGRWGGNITVTSDEEISSTPCAKMDNSSGCWESQLYYALPFHREVWVSADIMAEAAGRTGFHQMDAEIRLFNPDVGQWGRVILGIGIASRKTECHDGPGLVAFSGHCELNGKRRQYDSVILEEDYQQLTGRWINLMAKFPLSRIRRVLVAGACELTVQLELSDGTEFEGTCAVEVSGTAP